MTGPRGGGCGSATAQPRGYNRKGVPALRLAVPGVAGGPGGAATSIRPASDGDRGGWQHDALLYHGTSEFLAGTVPFIVAGIARHDPVMVAVPRERTRQLRRALGEQADQVDFVDMEALGRNPARIIPAWRAFLTAHHTRAHPPRGVGEPIWPGRSPAEVDEGARHEALLNRAFDGGPAWRLLCPYDAGRLSPAVVAAAERHHRAIHRDGQAGLSPSFQPSEDRALLAGALPEPSSPVDSLAFDGDRLAEVRSRVRRHGAAAGLGAAATAYLVVAAHELARNSVRHGGGTGRLRVWTEPGAAVCEVQDRGEIHDPLVGRRAPEPDRPGTRGLWLVNQVCDLVELRSGPGGTVARVRVDRVGARSSALAAEAARRLAILHGSWRAAADRGLEAADRSALGALSADARALLLGTAPGRSPAALPRGSGEGEPSTGPAVWELLGRGLLDPASPRGRGALRFTREAARLRSAWEVAARRAGEQQLARLGPDGAATLVRVLEGALPGG